MGDYTDIVTEADRDIARSAVSFMKERAQGNAVEFERQVVEYVAAVLAYDRMINNLLHEKDFGISTKEDVDDTNV